MSGLIVDTSVWIEFFSGRTLPELEGALEEGRVVLSPIVVAELTSGYLTPSKERALVGFLKELELYPTPWSHWLGVGKLRRSLLKKGVKVSVPDAHVAQCALDAEGTLYSFDKIFKKISEKTSLRLLD